MTGFAEVRVATDEAAIAVRILGTGLALVLLPGLGRSSHDLDAFATLLAAAGYRTLLPELRGMGGSAGPLDGIMQGLCDVSAPVGNGRLLHEEIGDRATLIELADVGHALPVEKPALVANTVIDFLRSRVANRSSGHG